MKFLEKYMRFFEAYTPDSSRTEKAEVEKRAKQVSELYNQLTDSNSKVGKAMGAIVALRDDYNDDTYYGNFPPATQKGTYIPDPSGAFAVYNDVTRGLRVSFKKNYTPKDCFIYFRPKEDGGYTYFFETAELTATFMGRKDETEEQKAARQEAEKGFFRFLNKEDSKNQFSKEKLKKDYATGETLDKETEEEKYARLESDREAGKKSAPPTRSELEEERKNRLSRNAQIEANRKAAYAAGNWHSVSNTKTDYLITNEFDNLEDCLKWAWAYFVARKTPRTLDKITTFVYLIKKFDSLKNKKLPIGDRYGSEGENISGTIIEDLEKEEGLMSDISTKRDSGLIGMYGEELKDMRSTVYFIKNIYSLLGLEVKPIEGSWDTSSDVSRGAVRKKDVAINPKETVKRPEWIIGFDISNNLSNSNTVLGAACKSFTNNAVKYMDRDLIFELAPRNEFKYTDGKKIETEISDTKVEVYFSCREEEEAFRKLLLGFKLQAAGIKAEEVKPIILSAFSGESKEIITVGEMGDVEEIKNSFILALIIDFTKNIAKNIEQFIPSIKSKGRGKSFDVPNINPDDVRILKILATTIDSSKNLIGKSLSIKQALKNNSNELYTKLVSAGMTPLKEATPTSGTTGTRTRTR